MNPIVFALRRPVTVMMLVLSLGLGGIYSIFQMQKDIFPSLNQPHALRDSQLRRDGSQAD